MRRKLGMMSAALILLAACGDDDGSDGDAEGSEGEATQEEFVNAVATSFREGEDSLSLEDPGATCVATAIVDVAGVDSLNEAGVTPDDLAEANDLTSTGVEVPDDAGTTIAAALRGCDVAEELESLVTTGLLQGFSNLPPDQTECMTNALDGDSMIDALANLVVDQTNSQGFEQVFVTSLRSCPVVLSEMVVGLLGTELSAEDRECVENYVTANAETVAGYLSDGDSETLTADLEGACPALAATDEG
jgi:hypothetical protein